MDLFKKAKKGTPEPHKKADLKINKEQVSKEAKEEIHYMKGDERFWKTAKN